MASDDYSAGRLGGVPRDPGSSSYNLGRAEASAYNPSNYPLERQSHGGTSFFGAREPMVAKLDRLIFIALFAGAAYFSYTRYTQTGDGTEAAMIFAGICVATGVLLSFKPLLFLVRLIAGLGLVAGISLLALRFLA